MTLNIDDDIILPLIVGISAIIITFVHTQCMFISTHEQISQELIIHEEEAFQDASAANREVDALTKELQSYRTTARQLESLGASHKQALQVIKAAETYDVNPLTIGALCKTESDFTQNCTHALPYVVGAFGISTKDHKDLPANPYSFEGNAKCSAYILRQNLDKYNGNYKKALTAYKGICSLGRARADEVLLLQSKI